MRRSTITRILPGLAAILALSTTSAVAKPPWAGNGHGEPRDEGPEIRININLGGHFGDHERRVVRTYFEDEFRGGHCPPGLAKKNNGCMPPGQAKKWRIGHRLPDDVVYYDLSPRLRIDLGTPPAGHKFIRVASDILLIAVGTGLVIDAIEDLGRL